MIGAGVVFLVRNLPAVLFVLAIIIAGLRAGRDDTWPERQLGWLLLLPIGVTGLWASVAHVFFPRWRPA